MEFHRVLCVTLFAIFWLGSPSAHIHASEGPASREFLFPLVADGDGYQSRLFLFLTNVSTGPNGCVLESAGLGSGIFEPHPALRDSGDDASIFLAEAGFSVTLESGLDRTLAFGYVTLDCERPVLARMLLSWHDAGAPVSMVALENAHPGNTFQFPVLPRLGRQGLLLANEAEETANCSIELRDRQGMNAGGFAVDVSGGSTGLHYLEDTIPLAADFGPGSATMSCTRPVAAVMMPTNGTAFTALPAIELDGDPVETETLILPLIADGDGFHSQVLVTNLAQAGNSCSLNLYGSGFEIARFHSAFGVSSSRSQAELVFANRGDQLDLLSRGEQSLGFGYLALTCDGPVAASNVLTVGQTDNPLAMAAVPSVSTSNDFQFPIVPEVDQFALVLNNDSGANAACTVERQDENGYSLGQRRADIHSRSTAVHFLDDWFVDLSFSSGVLRVDCDRAIAAVTMPLAGAAFAALPPISHSRTEFSETAVSVPDGNLRAVIAEKLGKGPSDPITDNDLAGLHRLIARNAGIGSLEGLQYAAGLTHLDLGPGPRDPETNTSPNSNHVADLTPIFSLKNLTELNLSHNNLSGPIPAELGGLSDLVELDLSSNQLTGPIPAVLADLRNLIELDLSSNRLTGPIPSELANLEHLQSLTLSATGGTNRFEGVIPYALLRKCRNIVCEFNETQLQQSTDPNAVAIPDENLRAVIAQELGLNPDESISKDELANLRRINARNAGIGSLEGLQYATGLTHLDLGPGPWDPETSEFANSNHVSDISPLLELSNLNILDLYGNNLTGPIPAEIGEIESLTYLSLRNNRLKGTIPKEIGNLKDLTSLDLGNNLLEGHIPIEISNLSSLKRLVLWSNRFTGKIFPELGNLTNLERIYLGHNKLSGSIPSEIGQLTNLIRLQLNSNDLNGFIPSEIGNLQDLTELDLSLNELSGPIPPEIGNLQDLTELDLSWNELSGPIPPEIGNLQDLTELDLSWNELSGTIPSEFKNLVNLERMSLAYNLFLQGILPWDFRDKINNGNLSLSIGQTLIIGYGRPPGRLSKFMDYSGNATDNGNASHHSIKYFQGPIIMTWDWNGEKKQYQTPVLGRWAMLAVTVDHEVEQPPEVITRVLDSQDRVLTEALPEAAWPSTIEIRNGLWRSQYYFDMPGRFFQSGNKIIHHIDPENHLQETNETDNVSSPIIIKGSKPPPFKVKFVPMTFKALENHDWAEDINLDTIMSGTSALLPIADNFEAEIRPPYMADLLGFLRFGKANFLRELIELWNVEAESDEFYHGIWWGNIGGQAQLSGRVAISGLGVQSTIPHEFGHNFSLGHPPGCGADALDPDYPYSQGGLGPEPGWNRIWKRFVARSDPGYGDMMSYCVDEDKHFISDYYYRQASEYWLSSGSQSSTSAVITNPVTYYGNGQSDNQTAAATANRSLALVGMVNAGGVWTLEQSKYSERQPRTSTINGEHTLVLFDNAGIQLHSEPITVSDVSHGEERFWAARTPIPLRPATEIAIFDADGNQVFRESLPDF